MNKYFQLVLGIGIGFFTGCSSHENVNTKNTSVSVAPPIDTTKEFGLRFSIVGDFNGDKIIDTVYESYISAITGAETYKTLDNQDWENNIDLVIKNKPVTRLYTSIIGVDTFIVTKESQQVGLFHYRALGDLDKNGKDEIGYAIKWADNSNLNTYHIITLESNKFKEVFSFKINEGSLYDEEGLFDNSELVKQKGNKTIQYKFYSASATIETGEYTFE